MSSVSPHIEVVASLPVAIESRPFEFICSTHNVCPGELSWEKDGVPVGVGSGVELALSGRALSFGSLEVGASGNYCCLLPAGGGIGQDLKSCAQLSIVGEFLEVSIGIILTTDCCYMTSSLKFIYAATR